MPRTFTPTSGVQYSGIWTMQQVNAAKDDYSRWFVAATSPHMHNGKYELGDTYASEIKNYGTLVQADPLWIEQYHTPSKVQA